MTPRLLSARALRPLLPVAPVASLVLLVTGCASTEQPGAAPVVRVAPPEITSAMLDPRYAPEDMRAAFIALCGKLGYRIERVDVDLSELPYLVYGVIEGRCDYREIRDALNAMRGSGYTYVGSFTANSGGRTCFALNMIPSRVVDSADRDHTRDRLKALALSQR